MAKLRKPTRSELLAYLKLSFITGAPLAKRELITKNVSSRLVKQGVAQVHKMIEINKIIF